MPPRYVMTCAHVVGAALGGRWPEPYSDAPVRLTVGLPGGGRLECSLGGGHRATGGSGHEDFAVLALHGDLARLNGCLPLTHDHLSGRGAGTPDRRMSVYGYPKDQQDGVWARCVSVGEGGKDHALIQLDREPGSDRPVERGFSGSGVQDLESRRVVGIAVLRDKAYPVSWMIPMHRIAEAWPPLRAALALSGEPAPTRREPADGDQPDDEVFGAEAMDQLYRLLLDPWISCTGLVELRAQALGPVRREWDGAPEDILGIVQDLRDMTQGVRTVPPLLSFVASLARRVPGARGQQLAHWVRDRAGHCDPVVDPGPLLTGRPHPRPRDAQWTYATFQITPAAVSRHYLLDVFRQHEGAPREAVVQQPEAVPLNRIEQLVVDQIARMQRERAVGSPELFVEFVLPRGLLAHPVDSFRMTTPSGAQVRLGVVHPVAVRSLERQNAPEWREWGHNWAQKWTRMMSAAALSTRTPARPQAQLQTQTRTEEALVGLVPERSHGASLYETLFASWYAQDGPVTLLLGFPPKVPRKRSPDPEFDAALDAGIPALVWAHDPQDGPEVIRETLARLEGASPGELPELVRRARTGERPGAAQPAAGVRVGLLWDPFDRLPPHTPLAPPAADPGGDRS
ncbi:hypothetical protein ACIBL6_02185 [Streptomyces sp. NPDC050400]|uniref:VMAP-C domain-containing protein n=1 Tax=Streptomyces sp. NPDC050400 TaxID=3365610 RepID=UPI00378BB823